LKPTADYRSSRLIAYIFRSYAVGALSYPPPVRTFGSVDLPHKWGGEERSSFFFTSPLVGEVAGERSEAAGGGLTYPMPHLRNS